MISVASFLSIFLDFIIILHSRRHLCPLRAFKMANVFSLKKFLCESSRPYSCIGRFVVILHMSVQYTRGYHEYTGGYHEYTRGYREYTGGLPCEFGGYHEYIGGCSIHWGIP